MKRKIEENLLKWKNDKDKKPLLIYGNKQVGKTYTTIKFGEGNYKNTVYFNAENIRKLFDLDIPYLKNIPKDFYYKFNMKYNTTR